MTPTDELERADAAAVQDLAHRLGADKVGIAAPGSFHLPEWTRSVVVLGQATLDEAFDYQLHVAYGLVRLWSKWAYERMVALAARKRIPYAINLNHRFTPAARASSAIRRASSTEWVIGFWQ